MEYATIVVNAMKDASETLKTQLVNKEVDDSRLSISPSPSLFTTGVWSPWVSITTVPSYMYTRDKISYLATMDKFKPPPPGANISYRMRQMGDKARQ